MKTADEWKQLAAGLAAGIREGSVPIPYLLIKYYHKMKLSEVEVMLLVHLLAYKEREKNDFPTLEEIESRMAIDSRTVASALGKLLKEQFISIDEDVEPDSHVRFERYNLSPLYDKIASCLAEEWKNSAAQEKQSKSAAGKDIFTIFENEFVRPLTPMEMETISIWLDRDGYKQELILAALKEAVFAGKVHFRYIDRILLDWSRNRVFTVEQAKEYAQKFRGAR